MSNANNKPRREPMCLDDKKLFLFAKPLQEGARSRRARIKLIENNPAFEIDYGIKTEGRNGKEGYPIKLEIPMSPVVFGQVLKLIDRVAAFKGQCGFEFENWGHPFIWDKEQGKNVRSKERLMIARTSVFKRDDGTVVLGFAAPKKPEAEFEFRSDEFHPLTLNGQPAPIEISSSLAAQGWTEAMSQIFFSNFVKDWKEPEYEKKRRLEFLQRQQQGGGNNYGQQRQNNNYQQPQQQQQAQPSQANVGGDIDSFDDELPF